MMDSLRWMLAPVEPSDFFANYWERKELILTRDRRDYFSSLLTLADLDRVLTTRHFNHPTVRLVTATRETGVGEYTYSDGAIDTRRLLKLYADGQTVIFNQLELEQPKLMEFCRSLERELSTRMQANVYLTPRNAQGFKPHYDSHDVFILQVHGSKRWMLYNTPIELPMKGQTFRPEEVTAGAVSREFDLHAGDVLYIPRGMIHDARTTGEDSLHITAGVLGTNWSEILLEAIGHAALSDRDLRRSLPVGFANPGYDRTEAIKTIRSLLQRVVDRIDPNALLDQAADDLISTRMAIVENQLEQLARLDEIGPDSKVGARPKLIYRVTETDQQVVLSVFGTELRLPVHAAPALRFALEGAAFFVRDLPGDLDTAGKVVLAKRLIREGLLRRL